MPERRDGQTTLAKQLTSRFREFRNFAVLLLGVGATYFVLAKLGLELASVNPSATPIWPPTGFALAAVLLWGYRVWPAIWAAALLANATTAGSVLTSSAIAVGNTAEALVAAYLMRRWADGRDAFDTPAGVARFALISLASGTLVSATIGVGSLSLSGYATWADFGPIWMTWWLGDVAGALVVTPVVVLWATSGSRAFDRGELVDSGIIFASAGAVGLAAFSPLVEPTIDRAPLGFLAILPLMWAALRRGQRDTATVALILSGFAIWGTLSGTGPFARPSLNDSFLLLLAFLISVAVPSLALSADVAARRRAESELRHREGELRAMLDEKEMLLAEVHHRVKNNLQLMVSLLHLEAQEAATDDGRERMEKVARRIEVLARIHEQLYTPADFARIDFGRHLEQLCGRLAELHRGAPAVTVAVAAEGLRCGLEIAVPLGLIAHELVSNSLKHAFPAGRGGTVRVSFRRAASGPDVELVVADDGIGAPPGARGSGGGLGRHLVGALAGQIGARVRHEVAAGTRVTVTVPGERCAGGAEAGAPSVLAAGGSASTIGRR
jgi:two-component sensor histidine kinase/integral membrane sensor domain MASE1